MRRFLTKRRGLLLATLLLVASSVLITALVRRNRLAQPPGVTTENFARIELGMKQDKVEEILGRPPDRGIYGGLDANGEGWFREWEDNGLWVSVLFVNGSIKNWEIQEKRGPIQTFPREPEESLLSRVVHLLRISK